MGWRTAALGSTVAALLACSGLPQPPGEGRGLPAGALRVEPALIVDATGFERPMAAATLFLPEGWTTEGGVYWGREALCTNGYVMNWRATSPDGSSTVAVLPQARWENNNYGAPPSTPGCGALPYTTTRQFLEAAIAQGWPGARIVAVTPREDLHQQFASAETRVPMPAGESRTWVDAAQARFTFDAGGRAMEGVFATVAVFNGVHANYGMGDMDTLTGTTLPSWAATGPAGTFDAGLAEVLRRSIATDPEWERRINGHNAAIARVALEESRKRSEILTRSNDEIARIRQEAWANGQESADRRAREFGEALRGVETYDDAQSPGGTVELSSNYRDAWALKDGTYVLTDDQSFDPWRDLHLEGTRLAPTP